MVSLQGDFFRALMSYINNARKAGFGPRVVFAIAETTIFPSPSVCSGNWKPKQLWNFVVVKLKEGALSTVAGEMHQELIKPQGK